MPAPVTAPGASSPLAAMFRSFDAGDSVAVRGAENLQEGAEVKIMMSQLAALGAAGGTYG